MGLATFAVVGCDPQGGVIASSRDASVGSGGGSGGSGFGGAATGGDSGSGGKVGSGGAGAGGAVGSGGLSASGGTTGTGGGSGGKSGTGGGASGGAVGSGGAAGSGGTSGMSGTGGKVGSGGAAGNNAGTGGVPGSGGATAKGGADGGVTGGTSGTGGTPGSGGSTGPCTPDWGTTPTNVSQWIDASWNSQLGSNVKTRKDWLIDNAMLGKGQINLCVRWGATTAPTVAVKSGMAAAVEKWFNDWFKNLDGYGCFPYSHITAKVTGWAVKPGKESWVSDLDSATIKIYAETDPGTDPPGEPQCASACSFFDNWTHTFPNCPGGEAFHTDYWLWLDDKLPGSGAAAVGGDWGLRMPVSNFVASMGQSNLVIEHEMGHGFGFQDYYDWGSNPTPAGGSLMIVGSTNSQTPTVGDTWLLRRTWKEMKTLRSW